MVDKIDPTNQTSVEYGQSLLNRKVEQEEKFAKAAQKDRKLNYAFQVLGGVDNLIKDQARRRVLERNNKLEQDIIREEAEFNKLQKEYELQTPWRTSSSAEAYAGELARKELEGIWGKRIEAGNLNTVETQEYNKSLKDLSEFHLNRYKENRVSALPFDTKEEYTADLRAQLNKEVPSGLLDIALRGVGFRGNKQEELDATINAVRKTYDDRLRDRPGIKGTFKELAPEVKAALLVAPKQDLSSKKSTMSTKDKNGRDQTVIKVETLNPETGNMDITFEDVKFNKLDNRIVDDVPTLPYFKDDLMRAEEKYRKVFPNAQKAQIHSAITNTNNIEFYDANIARGFERYSDLKTPFFTESNRNFKTSLEANFEIASSQDPDNAIIKNYNDLKEKQQDDFLNAVSDSANYYEKVGAYNERGTRIPIGSDVALALALEEQSKGFKNITTEGFLGVNFDTTVFERQSLGIHKLNQRPVGIEENRNEDGSPKSKEQLNADVIELSDTKEFQDLPVATQKGVLQNAANLGADINPELLKTVEDSAIKTGVLGPLELTGNEMLLADEGPTMQDAQEFLDREKETLSPLPLKTPIDLSTLTEEELEEYSRTGGEEALSQSNFFSRQQTKQRLKTLERYADGLLNKNRKPSPNTSVGKALRAFKLENMSRSEIKEWLKENTLETLAPKQ